MWDYVITVDANDGKNAMVFLLAGFNVQTAGALIMFRVVCAVPYIVATTLVRFALPI